MVIGTMQNKKDKEKAESYMDKQIMNKRIEKLKKQSNMINLIKDFRKGDKVKAIEERMKSQFGRNHGVDCDEVLEFVEKYGQGTAHFKRPDGKILTLRLSNVRFI